MAKIDRYNGNMAAFAADALSTERTIFGDTAQSNTLDANITADFLRGWGLVGVNENPTKQDFNGLAFTLGQLISYLHQRGIAEWNTAQEYFDGSVVTTDAGIYQLKSGGDGSSDPDTDDGSNWELIPTQAKVDAKADQATTYTKTEAAVDFGSTTDDLDTVVKSGFYRIQENANLPPGADSGQLIVSSGEDTILQLVSDFGGRLWQRSGNPSNVGGPGSYSDWQEISAQGIGVGQTWQDMTASRAHGVTYTNSTGKPITAVINVSDSGNINPATAFVDANRVIYINDLLGGASFTFIIPAGSTYKSDYSPNPLQSWVELR